MAVSRAAFPDGDAAVYSPALERDAPARPEDSDRGGSGLWRRVSVQPVFTIGGGTLRRGGGAVPCGANSVVFAYRGCGCLRRQYQRRLSARGVVLDGQFAATVWHGSFQHPGRRRVPFSGSGTKRFLAW